MADQRKKADVEEGDHKLIRKHSVPLSSIDPNVLKALRIAGDYIREISAYNDKPEGTDDPEEEIRKELNSKYKSLT